MSNFANLIWNEQLKIYKRASAWVMIGILAIIIIAGALITQFADTGVRMDAYGDDWRTELQAENERLTAEMTQQTDEGFYMGPVNPIQLEENAYYLENDIKPQPYDGWRYVLDNAGLAMLISLFTIIVAAGIVANEFKWGTIKLLLIRPISRTTILSAKYVSVLLFAFTLLLFLLVFSWLVGAVLFGLNGVAPTFVQQEAGEFMQVSVIGEIVQNYGLRMVTLVMMATFAFMISAIFRSSGMAIGLAIFLMFAGNTIVLFLSRFDWAKYILFANTNLLQYTDGAVPLIEGMTLTFSIIVLLVYLVLFLGTAWVAFTKRDIAGQ